MSQTIKVPAGGHIVKNYAPYMGDTLTDSFTVLQGTTPADVGDETWRMRIQDAKTGALFALLTGGSGITFPGDGKVVWTVTPTKTAEFVAGKKYVYDIQRTRTDGVVKTVQRGEMVPVKDITPSA